MSALFLEEKIKDWPPEKQDEARRGFNEFLSGVVQSLLGNVRRGFVNKFLDAIGPVEKIKIEFVADQIVEAKDSNRLRSKTLIGLVAAFESGIKYAVEAAKRGGNPSDIIDLLHKNVLTHETQVSSKSDAEKEGMIESWHNNADEDYGCDHRASKKQNSPRNSSDTQSRVHRTDGARSRLQDGRWAGMSVQNKTDEEIEVNYARRGWRCPSHRDDRHGCNDECDPR